MDLSVFATPLIVVGVLLLFLIGVWMLTIYEAAIEARNYYRRLNAEAARQPSRESVPQP